MNDIYQLQRFLDAQEAVYPDVVRELRGGRKESHWMWYIFPQVKGLGKSHISQKYALGSLDEATAYVQHPILGNRLHECTEIVVSTEESTVEQIFGYPDYLKFHSSMTLFSQVKNHHPLFDSALKKYFDNKKDQFTLETLGGSSI
ncbi:MAG: DUF1810 domain-containing protein [Proteobacteria bacterium]|nr:DUF1810 domain-containing protein [Pseudomonadota bacterium]